MAMGEDRHGAVIRAALKIVLGCALAIDGAWHGTARAQAPEVRVERSVEHAEWEVSFPDDITMDEYARQLDYFQIEIAASSKDGRVEYISHLGAGKPKKKVGQLADDPRLYIGWKSGALQAVDRRLLLRAGISSNRKEIIHFFPAETQRLMQQVERAHAKRNPQDIHFTRFRIKKLESGEGYEFVVLEQNPSADDER